MHLRYHAQWGDLGVVEARTPAARSGWIQVEFDKCLSIHRLTIDEIELVAS